MNEHDTLQFYEGNGVEVCFGAKKSIYLHSIE